MLRAPHVSRLLLGGLLTALAAPVLTSPSTASAAPGQLDGSFSRDGRVIVEFGRLVAATDVAILPNRKVVTAGVSNGRFAVARRTKKGKPDGRFSNNGRLSTRVGGGAYSVRLHPVKWGKLLVAGAVSDGDFVVVRYLRNGSLDRTFGTRGKARASLPPSTSSLEDLVVDKRGRILVAGILNYDQFVRVRYTRSGRLDTSFGEGGVSITSEALPESAWASTVRLQPDGRLVVVGRLDRELPLPASQMFVARYDDDGTLDESFGGGDGWTALGRPSDDTRASTAYVMSSGRILLGGGADDDSSALGRVTCDGEPDESFGDEGVVTHAFRGDVPGMIDGLTLQRNGKILATGTSSGAFTLARYLATGAVDTTSRRRHHRDGLPATAAREFHGTRRRDPWSPHRRGGRALHRPRRGLRRRLRHRSLPQTLNPQPAYDFDTFRVLLSSCIPRQA